MLKTTDHLDWGGTMVVHKLIQNHDGTLSVTVPQAVDETLKLKHKTPMVPIAGS